jgi:hypothetical protein
MKKNCLIGYAHETAIRARSSQFHRVKPFKEVRNGDSGLRVSA